MSAKRGKHILLSEEGWFLLETAKKETGFTDTKVTELCYAIGCRILGREKKRADEFMFKNICQAADSEREIHEFLRRARNPRNKSEPKQSA